MRYSADANSSSMKQIVVDAQDHPIEAVTLYNHRAEVRRIITLELNTGRNDFAIKNLPSDIVPDTLHFAGLSAGQASVIDTTCVTPPSLFGFQAYKPSSAQRKNEKIAELEAKRRESLRELSLINARSDVLLFYAKSLNGENTEPGAFVEFLEHFNTAGQSTLEATTRIEDSVREIDAAIKRINTNEESEDEDDKIKELSGKRKTKASVVLSAKEACTVKLSLTYVVTGASWSPSYELHATTDSRTQAIASTVTLHYHASILQTTGEDWTDVQLTLSTASSAYSSYVPNLAKSLVKAGAAPPPPGPTFKTYMFGQPSNLAANNPMASRSLFGAPQTNTTTSGGLFGSTAGFGSAATSNPTPAPSTFVFGAASTNNAEPTVPSTSGHFGISEPTTEESAVIVESSPELHALDRVGAAVNDQALASTYSIETNVTVQSDDIPHRVTIMSVQLGAKTQYVAVPKLSRAVYLSCKITNSTTHQFLPGPLVTYLDNSYVDRASLPLVPLKGTVTKSLGTDTAITATYIQTKKETAKAAAFSQRNHTPITDTITIKNTRPFTIPSILVRHAIPTPEDDQFRVTLKEPEDMGALGPGKEYKLREGVKGRWMDDVTSGPEISGLVEWTIDNLAADGKEEIKMVYEVAAPQDVKWHQT
ncbi:putative mucoidy inhibitor A [Rhizoctonia solani 123E]|uniref:Putative mucoidy inhibitor A n=1 Tax=Rhizoctonia solani 123E TaxID=1423351 RepID=A0A074S268_9AGAM|nr:putative mucoidy inhibitor A [Rhizoctonia solani 123E]